MAIDRVAGGRVVGEGRDGGEGEDDRRGCERASELLQCSELICPFVLPLGEVAVGELQPGGEMKAFARVVG